MRYPFNVPSAIALMLALWLMPGCGGREGPGVSECGVKSTISYSTTFHIVATAGTKPEELLAVGLFHGLHSGVDPQAVQKHLNVVGTRSSSGERVKYEYVLEDAIISVTSLDGRWLLKTTPRAGTDLASLFKCNLAGRLQLAKYRAVVVEISRGGFIVEQENGLVSRVTCF